jgi:hypothetical protein
MNYKFNKSYAAKLSSVTLFSLVTVLIEIQRRANVYRGGCKNHKLKSGGICPNVYEFRSPINSVVYSVTLNVLFFKGSSYPIYPYSQSLLITSNADDLKYRWSNNESSKGNERMEMLERMIVDLTEYLTNEYKQK